MNIPVYHGHSIIWALKEVARGYVRDYLKYRKSRREGLQYHAQISLSLAKQAGNALRSVRGEFSKELGGAQ